MSTKRNIANEIVQGMEDAVKYMREKKKKRLLTKLKYPMLLKKY